MENPFKVSIYLTLGVQGLAGSAVPQSDSLILLLSIQTIGCTFYYQKLIYEPLHIGQISKGKLYQIINMFDWPTAAYF